MTDDEPRSQISSLQALKRAWRFFAQLDIAAIFIFAVLLLAVTGSCFPQLSSLVAADPEQLARWETAVRARYGTLTSLLTAGGAFRCFRSPVFLVPLALLALATLVCTLERWRAVWRRAFRQPVHCSDIAFDAAPYTTELPSPRRGGAGGEVACLVHESMRQRGLRVRLETVEDVVYLRGDRNRLACLATLVTHLAVLFLLVGAVLSGVYGWREEITIGPDETIQVGHASRLALRNDGFTVTHYPNGNVAGYEAKIAITREGQEVTCGSIRVNEPLAYGSVGLTLRSYEGTEGQYSVTLLAAHDPGYGPVIAAGLLLLFGLTVSFNFSHCWVHARIGPDGTLRLAGRSDRRAWGFEGEFAAWVEDLEHATGG